MQTHIFPKKYFNPQDVLECGQVFRYRHYKKGYLVNTLDKAVYLYCDSEYTYFTCNDEDFDYFKNYFDLSTDYAKIVDNSKNYSYKIVEKSAHCGKGVRILKQDKFEMIISFIISQNNNIPRIKGIIEKLCMALGKKRSFEQEEYYSFPSLDKLATQTVEFYKSLGTGYRAEYILLTAKRLQVEGLSQFDGLSTIELKNRLLTFKGIGEKVANCILLFGFNRLDSFPVDTWIEKIYVEDFKGLLKDRNKISNFFVQLFKENAGIYQQYLFHYKRNLKK